MPIIRCPSCRGIYWSRRAIAPHLRSHGLNLNIAHGTVAGYRAECNRGDDTCGECRAAWGRYIRARRKASRDRATTGTDPNDE